MRVLRHPIHLTGRLLHHQVWLPTLEGTHQIVRERCLPGRDGNLRIGINGDDVEVRCPGKIVDGFERHHEVGRDGDRRGDFMQDRRFAEVAGE